jgi:heme/copper-type cytochrome/quinol oxidase subunit 2
MPITFEVVPQDIYDKWLKFAQAAELDAGNKLINDFKSGKDMVADNTQPKITKAKIDNNDINIQTPEGNAQ